LKTGLSLKTTTIECNSVAVLQGEVKASITFANSMGSTHPAFAPPLARASWGIPDGFEAGQGGVKQMMRYTFDGAATDSEAFFQTIEILRELAEKYVDHPEMVQFTRRLFNSTKIRNHDELGEIGVLVNYFQGSFTKDTPEGQVGEPLLHGDRGSYRYQLDPYGVELFQSPVKVIRDIENGESGADCDDIAAACACAMATAGRPVALMIVDADPGHPGVFNHVMLCTKTMQPNKYYGNDWFPVELIHPLEIGQSVPFTQFIPLLVMDFDKSERVARRIPAQFR
jgi:hypothetical protein